jgi:beta-glucosidase
LPFAWPADARSPVIKPLFALGYGLSYARPGRVASLSEDPRMDVAAALNVQNFFGHGIALSPWALTISDSGGAREVNTGSVASPAGSLSVTPIDLAAQEDARLFRWSGAGALAIGGPSADLSRQLNNAFALRLDGRVDSVGGGPVRIAIDNTVLDATSLMRDQKAGASMTVKIPLRCFAEGGANLSSVANPLRIEGSAGLALVLQSARVEAVGEPLACPPVIH